MKKNGENNDDKSDDTVKRGGIGRFFLWFVALSLGVSAIAVYRYAERPAEGVAIRSSDKDIHAAEAAEAVPGAFVGKYLTFMYGPKYVVKSDDVAKQQDTVILEQAYLSEPSAISKKIGLTVRSFPTHDLKDVPDYTMRENDPKRYHQDEFSHGSVHGYAFVPSDPTVQFEKTYFIPNDGLLAVLSVTAPSSADPTLDTEADAIAGSISWMR